MKVWVLALGVLCACGESAPRPDDIDTAELDLDSSATETEELDTPAPDPPEVDTDGPEDSQDDASTPDTPEPHPPELVEPEPDTPELVEPDTSAEILEDTAGPEPDADTIPPGPDTDTTDADTAGPTTCPSSVVVEAHPVLPSPYVPVCSALDYPTDPPTSGPHYPVWATYKTYLEPVNPGFLVHSLKHGAIVITWRCPDGCADDLTALRELINQRPQDPRCDPLLHHRIVVAPRPDQDRPLVASAWGHSFKADCFDLPALTAFIDAHYGQGLEDDCFEGVDVEKIRPDNPWYCPP